MRPAAPPLEPALIPCSRCSVEKPTVGELAAHLFHEHGLSPSAMSALVTRRSWAHIE